MLGGAKVSDKIAVLDRASSKVDVLVIGGAMANAFPRREGRNLEVEDREDKLALARTHPSKAGEKKVGVALPSPRRHRA